MTNSTMVVPISDALRECLRDPGFLVRLDGFILQVREWRQWLASDDYHEDGDHDHYAAQSALELVYGEEIWPTLNLELDAHDLNDVMTWAEQTKDPESEDPGSSE